MLSARLEQACGSRRVAAEPECDVWGGSSRPSPGPVYPGQATERPRLCKRGTRVMVLTNRWSLITTFGRQSDATRNNVATLCTSSYAYQEHVLPTAD